MFAADGGRGPHLAAAGGRAFREPRWHSERHAANRLANRHALLDRRRGWRAEVEAARAMPAAWTAAAPLHPQSAVLAQVLGHVLVARTSGLVERSRAPAVQGVDVRLRLADEHLHRLQAPLRARHVQRCPPVVVRPVHRAPLRDQHAHRRRVVGRSRLAQIHASRVGREAKDDLVRFKSAPVIEVEGAALLLVPYRVVEGGAAPSVDG
mmetsp:Transcript_10501/g.26417  ORF Transcript_10501/g.26417 Transcript_10501/m.26417 type:complete len:208 (+) Transcript_10501:923-1546(+)